MNKYILVLTASVKYPSSDNFYLTSNSYVGQDWSADKLEKTVQEFRSAIESDDADGKFVVTNMIAYIVPMEQVEELLKVEEPKMKSMCNAIFLVKEYNKEKRAADVEEVLPADIPVGLHPGVWGGYTVNARIAGREYTFNTNLGIRGLNAPCTIHVVGISNEIEVTVP